MAVDESSAPEDLRLVVASEKIRRRQEESPDVIDEASLKPHELQAAIAAQHLGEPELRISGLGHVIAMWSDEDEEFVPISLYETLLIKAVTSVAGYAAIGFDTGQWPGGLRWDEHVAWKRAIWLNLRKGSDDALRARAERASS